MLRRLLIASYLLTTPVWEPTNSTGLFCARTPRTSRLPFFLPSFLLLLVLHPSWMGPHASGSTSAATPSISVSQDGKTISATFDRIPLWQVLETLAGPLGFRAQIDPALAPLPVTATLNHVPVDQVLDWLLAGANYALIGRALYVWPCEEHPDTGSMDAEAWTVVSPKAPVATAPLSLDALHNEAVHAVDPADRLEAVETLMELGDEDTVVSALREALQDEEPELRAVALEALEDVEGPAVRQAIVQVAQHDPVPEHRA